VHRDCEHVSQFDGRRTHEDGLVGQHRALHAAFQHIDIGHVGERGRRNRKIDEHIALVQQHAVRIDHAVQPSALHRPDISPLARESIGTRESIHDCLFGAAREAAQWSADQELRVAAGGVLKVRRQNHGKSRGFASAPSSNASSREFGLRAEIDVEEHAGRCGVPQLIDQFGVMAPRPATHSVPPGWPRRCRR
jgi:hypothetical protein